MNFFCVLKVTDERSLSGSAPRCHESLTLLKSFETNTSDTPKMTAVRRPQRTSSLSHLISQCRNRIFSLLRRRRCVSLPGIWSGCGSRYGGGSGCGPHSHPRWFSPTSRCRPSSAGLSDPTWATNTMGEFWPRCGCEF
jgi:hypothetical protein